jgi:hypothetical protein
MVNAIRGYFVDSALLVTNCRRKIKDIKQIQLGPTKMRPYTYKE